MVRSTNKACLCVEYGIRYWLSTAGCVSTEICDHFGIKLSDYEHREVSFMCLSYFPFNIHNLTGGHEGEKNQDLELSSFLK